MSFRVKAMTVPHDEKNESLLLDISWCVSSLFFAQMPRKSNGLSHTQGAFPYPVMHCGLQEKTGFFPAEICTVIAGCFQR